MTATPKKERMGRRKSDPGTLTSRTNADKIATCELPWGGTRMVALGALDLTQLSGSFVGQSTLLDLFNMFERKLNSVIDDEPIEKLLNKTLQRGGDAYFDNLSRTLYGVSEVCLPPVLKNLLIWYEKYEETLSLSILSPTLSPENRNKLVKKLLAVNYLFCLVLIEILPQVEFHLPQCDVYIKKILDICFRNVQYKEVSQMGINNTNHLVVAETYGEVIGVLSSTYFSHIHRTFMTHINELKKDISQMASHQIISLIMAMKFVKIKTNQVDDFELGVKFLDDLASLMLEVKDKDVKHAVMGLLVEILLPVAAQIKRETNIPALISLVAKLYTPTNEMTSKKQHKLAAFPLQTCLLCVSQKHFFLANWVPFLNICLSHLKNRDLQVARVSLESLYRLLWVYMIRNNADGNAATRSRLESICGSLFPKGNRYIVPRDAPLNIFVKIIHFISNQKLDFAFKEIIFDLLCVNRTQRSLYAERMNIGIRALMVIADGLQQKDDPPAMPKSMGPLASGTVHKMRKKQYITRPLTAEISKTIGIDQFYPQCRKAFDTILRHLDTQIGKPLMMSTVQSRGKEPEELISGDAKPKLDLFRTCIAAIPRLLPEPMGHVELIDILTRLTVHIDEELRNMSGLTLQTIIGEFADWREQVFIAQLSLIQTQISDFYPQVLDDSLRLLLQLLTTWKAAIVAEKKRMEAPPPPPPTNIIGSPSSSLQQQHQHQRSATSPPNNNSTVTSVTSSILSGTTASSSLCSLPEESSNASTISESSAGTPTTSTSQMTTPNKAETSLNTGSGGLLQVLHSIEGLAIVYLCQSRSQPKKLAISLLKEVKVIFELLHMEQHADTPVITCLDEATPYVIRKYIEHVPLKERMSWNMDFASVCDKISTIETDNTLVNSDRGNEYLQWDAWGCALSGYAEMRHLLKRCPTAVAAAWPILFARLNAVSGYVDPNNPQNESRSSLLRGSKSKGTSSSIFGEQLGHEACLALWQKYLIMCCALAPAPYTLSQRSFSPTNSINDAPSDVFRSLRGSSARTPVPNSLSQLIAKACNILKWENLTDIRDSVVLGVGSINPLIFEMLLDELKSNGSLREAMEKKVETNLRRRKRKDLLRLQLIRIIEIAVFRGLLVVSSAATNEYSINSHIVDFIDSMRINLENDHDRDINVVTKLRLHFAKLIHLIVDATPHLARHSLFTEDRRQNLFYLFIGWCSRAIAADRKYRDKEVGSYVEQKSVLAMTRILCCGPIFEPTKSIGEDGSLYGWLEKLIVSTNPIMQCEVEEMLAWMLELNESGYLLDWLMTQCYTQSSSVACRCFRALVRVFSRRDFPCEFVSLFVLCQSMLAVTSVTDCALHMIEILRKQFLDTQSTSPGNVQLRKTNDIVTPPFGHVFPIEQHDICSRLANAYPHLTVTIFSEVSYRLEMSSCSNKAHLLGMLQPWISNLELVDQNVVDEAAEGPRGWGSEEATQLVLNNLLYLTTVLSIDYEKELAELWKSLAISFPANLPAILNFFYTTTLLSQDALLPVTKRVCVLISRVVGQRTAAIFLEWLSMLHDATTTSSSSPSSATRISLERSEIPPYYRWRDESKEREATTATATTQSARDTVSLEKEEEPSKDGVRLLPMPAYGGHYSPLSQFLPPVTQPVQFYTKSEVGLLLICDIIRTTNTFDWTDSIAALLFHSAILRLDSLRPNLCRHARQTLINVIMLFVDKSFLSQVSTILLKNEMINCGAAAADATDDRATTTTTTRGESPATTKNANVVAEEYRRMMKTSPSIFTRTDDLLAVLMFSLSENIDSPMWANEDANSRNWRVASAQQLACVVQHIVRLLIARMPMLDVIWTQLAMKMALSTSHRHIAGRCFQIVSALGQPPGAWIPSLMSRLVETAGEQHDETQAYVTDLLICLIDCSPQISMALNESIELRQAMSPTHMRSTSYTPALVRQSMICSRVQHVDKKNARLSLLVSDQQTAGSGGGGGATSPEALVRSKSAEQLLQSDVEQQNEETMARTQMLAIAVSLLESGMDNEFLLALQLLNRVLDVSRAAKIACLTKLDKMIGQLEWKNFNGIVSLVTRGAIVGSAYESSIQAMIRLCDVMNEEIVGGRGGVALFVSHALPYLVLNFENPNGLCIDVANAISAYCDETVKTQTEAPADHPFVHLSTVMRQYSIKTFTKDSEQFMKCVLQYICDGCIALNADSLLCLLAEMLERGWTSCSAHILHMIYLLLQHNHHSVSPLLINAQVIRSVSRHLQGCHWQEASKIYKIIVEKWRNEETTLMPDFSLDPSVTTQHQQHSRASEDDSPKLARKTGGDAASTSLKRMPPSHIRVRDRLVGILSASGLRIGPLPSSVSLVFSKSSDLGSDAAASSSSSRERICASSSQEVASTMSLPDPSSQSGITDSFPRVFKEFDFLEAEHDSVSETADSCFGWLSTMRPTRDEESGDEPANDATSRGDDDDDDDERDEEEEDDDEDEEEEDRTPCPSECCDEEEEEDDEMYDDAIPRVPRRVLMGRRKVDLETYIRPSSLAGSSIAENFSHLEEENTSVDGSYSNTSCLASDYYPNRCRTLRIQCSHHADAKVEREFVNTVNEINETGDANLVAYATLLSTQLYKTCCGKTGALLRDAAHMLTANRVMSRTFAATQETLSNNTVDVAYLFVTEQFLRTSPIAQRVKLSLNELREHWETFSERRDQCQKAINSLRSAYKLSALGGTAASYGAAELDVGKLLNKLVFQVMLMSDSLKEMADVVKNSTGSQTYSLSPAILEHHRELLRCSSEPDTGDATIATSATSTTTTTQDASSQEGVQSQHSCDSLVLLLANKRYSQALRIVRQLRNSHGEEYGCCETVDIDVLLLLFCRSHSLKAWALVGASPLEITRQSELLREANAEMATCVRRSQQQQQQSQQSSMSMVGTNTSGSVADSFAQID